MEGFRAVTPVLWIIYGLMLERIIVQQHNIHKLEVANLEMEHQMIRGMVSEAVRRGTGAGNIGMVTGIVMPPQSLTQN